MSIITEALKRAEKGRGKEISSEEYMDRVIGPERKQVYDREKHDNIATQPETLDVFSESRSAGTPTMTGRLKRNNVLAVFGGLLALTIVFLTAINFFVAQSPDMRGNTLEEARVAEADGLLEAEAYTEFDDQMTLPGEAIDPISDQFTSDFKLTGIVWDIDDPWAVVNNIIVKSGDVVGGAKVVSIEQQKATLLFRGREFVLRAD